LKTFTIPELKLILDAHQSWAVGSGGARADLSGADLSGADLSGANLRGADLHSADLRGAYLRGADLRDANLRGAYMSDADLSGADLSGAYLRGADLSGVTGIIVPHEYIGTMFEPTPDGVIAFKTFGSHKPPPEAWTIAVGSTIRETVNPDRGTDCGSGVNVATLEWVRANAPGVVWRVLIPWATMASVVVPFGTDGKIRCAECVLLGVVE
jgi:uncharacterized protein YjbI with pentapeptide repeats